MFGRLWVRIPAHDGHSFTLICCKNCSVCLKRPKINEKEAGVGTFKKNAQEFFLKFAREIFFLFFFAVICALSFYRSSPMIRVEGVYTNGPHGLLSCFITEILFLAVLGFF